MSNSFSVSAAIAAFLVSVLGVNPALASVKCQCNNGAISVAMDADYDDDDVASECNDACSGMGGGRVWNVDTDQPDNDSTVVDRNRVLPRPGPRPR